MVYGLYLPLAYMFCVIGLLLTEMVHISAPDDTPVLFNIQMNR
jgi:hypothetical protein